MRYCALTIDPPSLVQRNEPIHPASDGTSYFMQHLLFTDSAATGHKSSAQTFPQQIKYHITTKAERIKQTSEYG